jgi:hypothetical protein
MFAFPVGSQAVTPMLSLLRPLVVGAPRTVRAVVVTEVNAPWFAWARTFAQTFASIGASLVIMPNTATVKSAVAQLQRAANTAGPGGFIVLSVGHGGVAEGSFGDEGFFDIAPHAAFRVAGRNAYLVGDTPPSQGPVHKPAHVSAFYDERVPNAILRGGFAPSRADDDRASTSASAKVRLANWQAYQDVAATFARVGLSAVIILSCKVGKASGFIGRVRQQWGVPIIGYPRRVVGQPVEGGRTRIFLEGDRPQSGTNIPFDEYMFPLSPDMVVFR